MESLLGCFRLVYNRAGISQSSFVRLRFGSVDCPLPTPSHLGLRTVRQAAQVAAICLYSLAATLFLSEAVLHRRPELALGDRAQRRSAEVLRVIDQSLPDPDAGKLGEPNLRAMTNSRFDLEPLYAPGPWCAEEPPTFRFHTDSLGFRNDADLEQADLVAIGDSFTQGHHVQREEIWAARLAVLLEMTHINLGMSGYGPQQQAAVLRKFGLPKRPRLVVWQFCLENDLQDAMRFEQWRATGLSYRDYVRQRSRLNPGGQLFLSWELVKRLLGLGETTAPELPTPALFRLGDRTLPIGFLCELHTLVQTEDQLRAHPGFAPTLAALEQARRDCTAQGVPLLVFFVPSKLGVYLDHVADATEGERLLRSQGARIALGVSETSTEETLALVRERRDIGRTVLAEALEKRTITVLDLTPAFREQAAQGNLLYYAMDSHWNAAGHDFAARLLAAYWREHGD